MTRLFAESNLFTAAAAMPSSAAARSEGRIHPCELRYLAGRSWRVMCGQKPQSLRGTDPGRERGARRKVG